MRTLLTSAGIGNPSFQEGYAPNRIEFSAALRSSPNLEGILSATLKHTYGKEEA